MKKVSFILLIVVVLIFSACSASEINNSENYNTEYNYDSSSYDTIPSEYFISTNEDIMPSVDYSFNNVSRYTEPTSEVTSSNAAQSTEYIDDREPIGKVNVIIDCSEILNHYSMLNTNKSEFVPYDGIILDTVVSLYTGDTVFDVLKNACARNACNEKCEYCKNGIDLEFSYTPMYKSYYVEGIHQLYEFDCGPSSGWLYSVNDVYPNVSSSERMVDPGDTVQFRYTCTGPDFYAIETTTDPELPPF